MIYFLSTYAHSYTLQNCLQTWTPQLRDRVQLASYEALFDGAALPTAGASFIFADMDRITAEARARLVPLYDELVRVCGAARVLNHPVRSMGRLELLQALHASGSNTFGAWCLADPVVPQRFPLILRDASGFLRSQVPLVRDQATYAATLASLQAQQAPLERLIAVEYCDTADAAGVYRKYGAFVVGARIIPRHVQFDTRWMVKLGPAPDAAQVEEERAYVAGNPHAAALLDIARRAGISYGRIDYGLLGGRPQVWEINTNPWVYAQPSRDDPARDPVQRDFARHFADALLALDEGTLEMQ